ncbi:hypothetical protein SAMN05444161_0895 [Rhizobiales bacterium GAS191]|jgi:hypothetical protein|nr:hypothetical protein SAMN05444161_0895 [Rhizobiales bacterium GAS191]SEC93845.1 hypothetical protein SAMN05519104_2409 [Rhizobiales bacterium GAS188]
MRKAFLLAAAVSLSAALAPIDAQAFSVSPSNSGYQSPNITLVAGGCGYGYHPGPYGGCRPNGPGWGGPRPGWVGPGPVVMPGYGYGYGRRCWMRPTPYGPRRVCN